MLTTGWSGNIECVEGVPPGARFVRSYTSNDMSSSMLVFEHESFDNVKNGHEIPLLFPMMRKKWEATE
jgi:hypothetical protein